MVNFSGALRGLGVGLTQVGQLQYQQQQEAVRDQRLHDRQIALAELQQRIRNEDADVDAKRDLQTNAVRDDQLLDRDTRELKNREPFREREAARASEAEAARDAREAAQEETRDERELRQEIARENRAAAREEAQERRRLEREGDGVIDRYVNDQDQRVLVTRSGQEIVLQNRVRRTSSADSLGTLLEEDAAAETPAVAGTPAAAAPRQPARRQQPAGQDVPVGTIARNPRTGQRMRLKADGTWEPVR